MRVSGARCDEMLATQLIQQKQQDFLKSALSSKITYSLFRSCLLPNRYTNRINKEVSDIGQRLIINQNLFECDQRPWLFSASVIRRSNINLLYLFSLIHLLDKSKSSILLILIRPSYVLLPTFVAR